MGKPTGFMEIPRAERKYAPAGERIQTLSGIYIRSY